MKSKIFIGSSVEGLAIAEAMQHGLHYVAEAVIWNQGVFNLSRGTLEDLIGQAKTCDFGIFILSPDDLTKMRKEEYKTARDNVLLEFGLFTGILGKDRVFFVVPSDKDFHLPTDLLGLTAATYSPGSHDGNISACMGSAIFSIKQAISKLVKPIAGGTDLNGAWSGVWFFSRNSYPEQNTFDATLSHIGDTIRASFVSNKETYRLIGKIERGHIINGIWGDPNAGASYFGPFQLVISPNGKLLSGKWCGFGKDLKVDAGDFVFERKETLDNNIF